MKVGLAQINACVGDLAGNVARCQAAVQAAGDRGADLVVLPEMAIPGNPPRDILLDSSFVEAVFEATADLAHRIREGPPTLVGSLGPAERQPDGNPGVYDAAVLLEGGRPRMIAAKRLLQDRDVFHDSRWFCPGPVLPAIPIAGRRVGAMIGEDLVDEGHDAHPAEDLLHDGADFLICVAAAPYTRGGMEDRLSQARRPGCPLVHVNLCGGQDELIFDGRSFVLNGEGQMTVRLAAFREEVRVVDLDAAPETRPPEENREEELYQALVLGVRDFAAKNGLDRAFLGVSGGIDSAVVAVIACEALGPDRVTGVAIPSRYTDPRSTECACGLAEALGMGCNIIPLEPLHVAAEKALGDLLEADTANENVQARLRAMILMGFVNRHRGFLLNTSNKTEASLGYGTLYGDMAGTLCPIGDVTKPEIFALAHWINSVRPVIPQFILDRPPSAELRPDQVDPFDYPKVAPAMERLVQANQSDSALRRSEHKRWQMGVVLKVSKKSFGTGRLIPITRR